MISGVKVPKELGQKTYDNTDIISELALGKVVVNNSKGEPEINESDKSMRLNIDHINFDLKGEAINKNGMAESDLSNVDLASKANRCNFNNNEKAKTNQPLCGFAKFSRENNKINIYISNSQN